MQHHVIDFVPPIVGIEGSFNTFRLGLFYSKRLQAGDVVYLMDNREKRVIGKAKVTGVDCGTLSDMLSAHARMNHAVLFHMDGHAEALRDILQRFYGPHIAVPSKKTTVIHLKRMIANEQVSTPSA